MGCDIHVWIEKRDAEGRWRLHAACGSGWHLEPEQFANEEEYDKARDTCWEHAGKVYPYVERRNYARFGALAGVRTDGPDPKGWPADVDPALRGCLEHPDLHSHSWHTLAEAARIWAETEWSGWEGYSLYAANPIAMYFNVDTTKENPEGYRVVYAFDN